MAINPDKCIKVTGRFHSTQGTVGDPALTNVVSGADEVYDDDYPLVVNGYVECHPTPIEDPTGNPHLRGWCEAEIIDSTPTGKYFLTEDASVTVGKNYYKPIGAKQDEINQQLRTGLSDITAVTITPSGEVITSDPSKIIGQEDGYIPTAKAVGLAIGANFEDNLTSTSTVKGLTANMGRVLNENKADINGYYETMSVGSAKNLDGENTNSEAYLIRPTGGENNEVVNGLASVVNMEGNSCVWNQLVKNGDYSQGTTNVVTFRGSVSVSDGIATYTYTTLNQSFGRELLNSTIQGHKYYVNAFIKTPISMDLRIVSNYTVLHVRYTPANTYTQISAIVTAPSTASLQLGCVSVQNGTSYTSKGEYVIDLSLLGIDNLTTVAEVKAWLAQHPGTKPHYVYNLGTILSANTLGFKTYSRNLLNPSDGLAKLISYTHTTNSNKYTVKGIPTGAAVTYTPDNTGVAVDVTSAITDNTFDISSYGNGTLYIPNATANTYVCMKHDGAMDDEVVPYKDNTYNFDVRNVYGKNNGVEYQCFPNGMRSAGSVRDEITATKAIKRVGVVDLGTLNYEKIQPWGNAAVGFRAIPLGSIPSNGHGENVLSNSLCSKYMQVPSFTNTYVSSNTTGVYTLNSQAHAVGTFAIIDKTYDSYTVTQFKTAMSGVMLYYQLATPITYTDLIYRDGGIDRPLREVLVNLNVDNWSMEEQLMTDYDEQGNPTSVPATIQTKYSIDAVEAIKTLEESSYFESDIHDNFAALIAKINEKCASVLGGTLSISDSATNKLFTFGFTENASTNSTEENTETI